MAKKTISFHQLDLALTKKAAAKGIVLVHVAAKNLSKNSGKHTLDCTHCGSQLKADLKAVEKIGKGFRTEKWAT